MNVVNKARKISKKERYELTNTTKRQILQNLLTEILYRVKSLIETQLLISEKITYIIKKYPYEVKQTKQDTQTKIDNLIKSGLRYKVAFSKSVKLSENLTTFLKVNDGATMSVSEIVNNITQYIRAHKLQDPSNRKAFNPDENLQKLFAQVTIKTKNKGYTYYGIQKYIKPHLIYS